MEQQTIRIRQTQSPPPFLTQGHYRGLGDSLITSASGRRCRGLDPAPPHRETGAARDEYEEYHLDGRHAHRVPPVGCLKAKPEPGPPKIAAIALLGSAIPGLGEKRLRFGIAKHQW